MGRVILVGSVAAVVTLVLVWLLQRSLIYFPFGNVPEPHEVGLPEAEAVSFSTEDGLTLSGWFVGDRVLTSPYTVLVFNGNAGNRAFRAPLASALRQLDLQVLLFDYRGYGDNAGRPSEEGLRADARAARRYVAAREDVDPQRIIYFGESLGTAVATGLATEHEPAGLILRSPFTSLVEVGQRHYPFLPVGLLLADRFMSLQAVRRVEAPVLVLAGDRDRVIPFEQSRRIYEAAPVATELVVFPGADHNDYELLAGDQLKHAVGRFVGSLGSGL